MSPSDTDGRNVHRDLHGQSRPPGRPGSRPAAAALGDASVRAARDGVGRGLRALYADTLEEPMPDDLAALVGRFSAGP